MKTKNEKQKHKRKSKMALLQLVCRTAPGDLHPWFLGALVCGLSLHTRYMHPKLIFDCKLTKLQSQKNEKVIFFHVWKSYNYHVELHLVISRSNNGWAFTLYHLYVPKTICCFIFSLWLKLKFFSKLQFWS